MGNNCIVYTIEMHHVSLTCTKMWIWFIEYNTSYYVSVVLFQVYSYTHTHTRMQTGLFLKTISKSQNTPKYHYRYLYSIKMFHRRFKN